MTGPNPLKELRALGQSVWLDYIRRDLLTGGALDRLIREDGLAGMTSNPTIFHQAIAESDLYDDDIREAGADAPPDAVFETIAVADVQQAADHFRPLFDKTGGADGFVSIEVRPGLASDTDGTIDEARRLWQKCARPNVMVKIPGTDAGIPAIRQCLADGININITLLFSLGRYEQVIDAWFDALEERVRRGEPVARLASVASFFISRVDTLVDERLEELIALEAGGAARQQLEQLLGQAGIANARLAYQLFEEQFGGQRFGLLAAAGARRQRPLWASTSTKNPALPDIYYVEALAAPDSINTLPPDTLDAYRDHGDPRIRIREDLAGAHLTLTALGELGLNFGPPVAPSLEPAGLDVGRRLEEEGIDKFSASYDHLLDAIAEKQRQVQPA